MFELVFSASDIVSLVLILIEIKCCNCFEEYTEFANGDIQLVLKAAFGWSGIHEEVSASIRKTVAKFVLLPKFLFSALAFAIEFGILYSENASVELDLPGGRWTVVGVVIFIYIDFLAAMSFFVCCYTHKFEESIIYFSFLLFYRILDLGLNCVLLWMSVIFDELNTNSIVTHLITIYCSIEIVVAFIQLCKAVFLLVKSMLEKAISEIFG